MPSKTIQKQRQNLGMITCVFGGGGSCFVFLKLTWSFISYFTVSLFLFHNKIRSQLLEL